MAGVKGRSGGKRPGAGRKPAKLPNVGKAPAKDAPQATVPGSDDPKKFLAAVMNDIEAPAKLRVEAAKALMPFVHQKLGEGGKKDERQDAAKEAGKGKFAAAAAPLKLVRK